MSAPGPTAARATDPATSTRRPLDQARLRAWLAMLVAVLLVLVYLSGQFTYGATHLDPPRYRLLAPGAPAHAGWADFRLLSVERTTRWGSEAEGDLGVVDPGSEWVVARLEVTPYRHQKYMLCSLLLVSTDGRSWESALSAPDHEGESCVPDDPPDAARLGTTYPIVVGYRVPAAEADHLVGLALDPYSWHRYQLLRPPV